MANAFQAYTSEGILRGELDEPARLSEALEHEPQITLRHAQWEPLASGTSEASSGGSVATDDLLLVVAPPETSTPVHAAWNAVSLVVPPYVIEGDLPTLPGFDPGRALTRPGGPFVLLGHVRIEGPRSESEPDEHPFAWVNRYAVERVESELELLVFFPGAAQQRHNQVNPPPSTPPAAG